MPAATCCDLDNAARMRDALPTPFCSDGGRVRRRKAVDKPRHFLGRAAFDGDQDRSAPRNASAGSSVTRGAVEEVSLAPFKVGYSETIRSERGKARARKNVTFLPPSARHPPT
jgi:hypothetical protein